MTRNEAIELLHKMKKLPYENKDNKALNMAIMAIEEVRQYRQIGTIKKYQEIMERQKGKKPVKKNFTFPTACPDCGSENIQKFDDGTGDPYWFYDYCPDCGQKIDWSEDK